MHAQALMFARRAIAVLPIAGQHVLEIGSRDINGSVRPLFVSAASYTGIDIVDGPGVDIVVTDHAAYEPEQAPSVVVCMEVLEHTPHGQTLIERASTHLRPGGWLLVTCATDPRPPHSGVDGGQLGNGEYYDNVAPQDLRGWLDGAGLTVVLEEVHARRGDLYALARKPAA